MDAFPRASHRLLPTIASLLLVVGLAFASQDFSLTDYRALVAQYRAGDHDGAARALQKIGYETLAENNVALLTALELDRIDEKRALIATALLHAEAAVRDWRPDAVDFYLDEVSRLMAPLGEDGDSIQRDVHLAIAYDLYSQRRVVDALRVAAPAAARWPTEPSVQLAHASLAEIVGWLNGSDELLSQSRAAYEHLLFSDPVDARIAVRLARVLTLQGEHLAASSLLRSPSTAPLDRSHRFVRLLTLGRALRESGELERALDAHREALEMAPGSQQASVGLSFTLRETGRAGDGGSHDRGGRDLATHGDVRRDPRGDALEVPALLRAPGECRKRLALARSPPPRSRGGRAR